MFRSGFSGGAMNQGGQSEDNKMAIGAAVTMSYGQFFGYEKGMSAVIPDFTRAFDDYKLSLKYEGGTSAFFIRSAGKTAASVEVVGCTDYSYSGDQNLAQSMTVNDCRTRINGLTSY